MNLFNRLRAVLATLKYLFPHLLFLVCIGLTIISIIW